MKKVLFRLIFPLSLLQEKKFKETLLYKINTITSLNRVKLY